MIFPSRRQVAVMFSMGPGRTGGKREQKGRVVAEKCPRQGQTRNQNEPTGMISSRLNAGFKFVSDSIIDSVSDPAHKLSHQRTVGGCARLGSKHPSPVQPYPLTPPSPPLGAPALPRCPLSPLPTTHSGVSTCGSLATAAVADYQGEQGKGGYAAFCSNPCLCHLARLYACT